MRYLLVGLWVLLGLAVAEAQESLLVVINEFGQGRGGNGEWVELLVVGSGTCPTVDLRGWKLRDYQGNATGGVWVVFGFISQWQAVPAGTLIVIYNAGDTGNLPSHFPPYPDADLSDFLVVLPHNHAYFAAGGRWEGLANTGDWVVLLDAGDRLVDGVSYGDRSGQTPHLSSVPARRAAAFVGSGIDQINTPDNWVVGYEVAGEGTPLSTPGLGNSPTNAAWIESLCPKPKISVSPAAFEFGAVPVGQEATLDLTVSNTGCAALAVGTVNLTGPHASEFVVRNDHVSGATLPPGTSRTLQVVFRPASSGTKTATLRIPSNDPLSPVVSVPLSGTGVAPRISVTPLSYDFGPVLVGQESAPLTVTVGNTGSAPLVVGTVSLTGSHAAEFELRNDNVSGATIPVGESRTLQVVFKPVSSGDKTAFVQIPCNDAENPVATVSLRGTGQAPLSVSAGGPYFGVTGAPVTLRATASGGFPPYSFAWDLDDDGEFDDATGAEVAHVFAAPGAYTVGVQATDSRGYRALDRTTVTIAPAKGDVNGDGRIDLVDLRLAYQAVLGLTQLSPAERERADMNGDGLLDLSDVQLLCQLILGGCG